ncbi:caffeoylshikimate esterase [Quercus suber]|uniref:Caffeoylshikimate esterase n=2 Tax=Quercus suber TaxID=58331 RepID=A0AAW0JZS7_QUESU
MLNQQNMKIFTQSWRPNSTLQLKGIVAMVHGYNSESSWFFELTAVAIAKTGFLVCAIDLQGHGSSDGLPGHIPNIVPIVCDCIQFFDSIKVDHPKLPAFIYGESLGGAIAILVCLKQKRDWNGLILNGSTGGISAKFKPTWPLEKLLPVAAFLAPIWKIVISKLLASKSYKEWKRKLVVKNPNRKASGKPPMATALELLRVSEYIRRHCHELEVTMLMVHGEDDVVCDYRSARFIYESAASEDKRLKIFPSMWHQLIGEPKENMELVYGFILS